MACWAASTSCSTWLRCGAVTTATAAVPNSSTPTSPPARATRRRVGIVRRAPAEPMAASPVLSTVAAPSRTARKPRRRTGCSIHRSETAASTTVSATAAACTPHHAGVRVPVGARSLRIFSTGQCHR